MFSLLAAADTFDQQVKQATQTGRFDAHDAMTAISIGLAIGVLLFVWAYFRYRKKEDVETRRSGSDHKREAADPKPDESADPERRRVRKRRRRRDHRPRNPSLQQTGGLPPPRPDDQLPKY